MKNNLSAIYSVIKISLLIISFLVVSNNLNAQPPEPIDIDAPVDGGLSFLLATGIGYAIKKLKRNHRRI